MSKTEFERISWFSNLIDGNFISPSYVLMEIVRYLSNDQAKELAEEFCRLNGVSFSAVLKHKGD